MNDITDNNPSAAPTEPSTGADPKTLYLYANEWNGGYHLVSQATVDQANADHQAVEDAPYYENYGELRRAGELDELAERLSSYGVSLEEYAASIERSADEAAHPGTIAERLAALDVVDFDGDDDDNTPGDGEDFRPQHELDNEVADENVFMHVIQTSMDGDVPDDLLTEFCSIDSPMFVEYTVSYVTRERLEPLITALKARGYTVVRDN